MATGNDRLWAIDRSRLQPGDILLERGEGWLGFGIRLFDWGRFAHALIWVGPTDFMEAVKAGTRVISFARFVVRNADEWTLLRLPDNPTAAAAAAQAARSLAHIPYSTAGALKTKSPLTRKAKGQFCSELVARCYLDAGVELVPDRPTHRVTPNALVRGSRLVVVDSPFVEITDPLHREQARPLLDRDRAYETSEPAKELRLSQAILRELADTFPLLRPSSPGLMYPPENLSQLQQLIAVAEDEHMGPAADRLLAASAQHGYFHLLDGPLDQVEDAVVARQSELANPHLATVDRESIQQELMSFRIGWTDTRDRHRANAEWFEEIDQLRPHPLWVANANMHRSYVSRFEELIAAATAASAVRDR